MGYNSRTEEKTAKDLQIDYLVQRIAAQEKKIQSLEKALKEATILLLEANTIMSKETKNEE